jgi:DNA-binding transcriptional regulator YiaG
MPTGERLRWLDNRCITQTIHKLKGQSALAPARCWAHWTFTQRTIHVVLASKSAVLKNDKQFSSSVKTPGDRIVAARKEAGLTQEQLAETTGIHRQWLGRWERGRALPSPVDWHRLSGVLHLPPFEP